MHSKDRSMKKCTAKIEEGEMHTKIEARRNAHKDRGRRNAQQR